MGILTKATSIIARGLGLVDPRLYHFFSGGPTHAGEAVTVDSTLQLDTVWACVRLISQTIATLPLFLYKRGKDGRGVVDDTHQLYYILHDRPNVEMTATEFWEAQVAAVLLWGNSYAAIERGVSGVISLTPMRPDRVTVRRQTDGSLIYHYSFQGFVASLPGDQVFHIKGFSLDGLMGISPITQARQSIASAIAAEKASGAFFQNGMRPSAIMEAPSYLTDIQREQAKNVIADFTGAINTGKVPLLEGGWKINTAVSLPPEDAQLLETRSFHVEQLCRWFDVPPAMVGHMEKTTAWGTGLEQMLLWFLAFCLRPHLKRIEQAISKALLTLNEQGSGAGGLYAEFNVEGLLRADSAGRAALYKSLVDTGVRTRNEIRELDNLPPLEGGDDLTVMSNMLPLKLLGEFVRGKTPKPLDPGFVVSQQDPSGDVGGDTKPTGPLP